MYVLRETRSPLTLRREIRYGKDALKQGIPTQQTADTSPLSAVLRLILRFDACLPNINSLHVLTQPSSHISRQNSTMEVFGTFPKFKHRNHTARRV